MALYFIKDTTLTGIADAIRSKTGSAGSIPVGQMASKISSIVAGGGSGEGGTILGYEVVKKSGEFTTGTGVKSKNITHNCGGSPDLVIVYLYRNDLTACADYTTFVYSSSKVGIGSQSVTSGYAASESSISCTSTTFNVSNLAENSRYKWVAMKLVDKEIPCGGDYTVTFMSEDGQTVLYEKQVMEHDNCANPVTYNLLAKPTKESTAQYDYTFSGWSTTQGGAASSSALTNITDDRTVYVAFNSAVRYYTVNFYDGETLLKSMICEYGTTPSYTPKKTGYIFAGWDKELAPVTGDANYYAQWEELSVITASGQCGDAAYWEVYDSGILRIYGEGSMDSYTAATEQPWYDYASTITSIRIENGITAVGNNAFRDISSITSVGLADSIVSIGTHAFRMVNQLDSITIPAGVTSISDNVFNGCSALTSITIQGEITSIGKYALSKTALTSFVVPDTVTTIGDYAFYSCGKLSAVTISSEVTSIGFRAFESCSNLSSANFKDATTWYVSSYADGSSAMMLTSVYIASASTSATYLKSTYSGKYWNKK